MSTEATHRAVAFFVSADPTPGAALHPPPRRNAILKASRPAPFAAATLLARPQQAGSFVWSVVKPAVRQLLFGAWTPRNLFGNTQGAWYDPSDLSSMFQDSAGTTPCAVGSPVGLRLDKSGRGNHLLQGTSASRGILRQDASGRYYIEYDGFDDGYATAGNVDFTATDKIAVFAGLYKASDAATGISLELSASAGVNNGSFNIAAPVAAMYQIGFNNRGTLTGLASTNSATYAAPVLALATGIGDIGGDVSTLRLNGAVVQTTTSDQGTGNYSNYPLYLGRRGGTTLPFNGRDYGVIVVGRALSATEIARTERWLANRMGVSL